MSINSCPTTKRLGALTASHLAQPCSQATRQLNGNILLLISRLLRSQKQASQQPETGFTLLECLVAIVIISITLVAITPPIFLATATRVQSRRGEQALQLAQAEVDRVRTVVERGVYTDDDLPEKIANSITNIKNVPAPTSIDTAKGLKTAATSGCTAYNGTKVASTALLRVDTDGDCQPDFLVQTFRTEGVTGVTGQTAGFKMGVRVYVYSPTLAQNLNSLRTDQASLRLTGGLGQVNRPASVLYSTVVRNDTTNSLENYKTLCEKAIGC